MSRRTFWMLAVLSCAIGQAGCGPGNGLNLAPVRGKVTYMGQPIKNGTIIFEPDESKGTTGPQAIGTITSDGTYILSSENAGDGAVVGHHKVAVLGLEENPVSNKEMPKPDEDPLKYLAAKTQAGLEAAKAATKKNADRIVSGLDGKPFRIIVPESVTSTRTTGIIAKVESGSNVLDIDITDAGIAKIK